MSKSLAEVTVTHRRTTPRAPSDVNRTSRIVSLVSAVPLLLSLFQSTGCDDGLSGPRRGGNTGGGGTGVGPQTGGTNGGFSGGLSGGASGVGGTGGTTGAGFDTRQLHQFCEKGYDPDPRDALITNEPVQWVSPRGEVDLVLPQPVLDWMSEGIWQKSHDAWHNIRRCSGPFRSAICSQVALVPRDQECENASDGFQFLAMHRHMIEGLKQAFPRHADLFEGFPSFPFNAQDVPEQWRSRFGTGWNATMRRFAERLDDIENHLGEFPTEGDLGKFIQCEGGAGGLHGAMHFKWQVASSPHSLGKQPVNIENYMFWKLHGWIDDVWERYRVAKGLTPDDPRLAQELVKQCNEMHELGHLFEGEVETGPVALPEESGFFHEKVRPIFEARCPGCHMAGSAQANMALTGNISSTQMVAEMLVNVGSSRGGQFKRVVPNDPDQSWLYLKAAGLAASVVCVPTGGGDCQAGSMPPGADLIPEAELAVIRQWIEDGAPMPTRR